MEERTVYCVQQSTVKNARLYDCPCWPVRFLALWQLCAMSFGRCVKQRFKRYGSCGPNSCSACLARYFTLHWENALIAWLWNGLTLWHQNESYFNDFHTCKSNWGLSPVYQVYHDSKWVWWTWTLLLKHLQVQTMATGSTAFWTEGCVE